MYIHMHIWGRANDTAPPRVGVTDCLRELLVACPVVCSGNDFGYGAGGMQTIFGNHEYPSSP